MLSGTDMPLTAVEMIAALDAFEPDSGNDENQFRLYPITEGFKSLTDSSKVIPAMFSLLERFPNADLGSPGPLVHSIESAGIDQYLQLLVASIQRQPTDLSVWMVNRILKSELSDERRLILLDLLRSVLKHPKAPSQVAETAQRFLDYQAKRAVG